MSKTTRTGILTRLFPPDWELRLVLSLSIIFLLYLITTAIKAYQLSTTNVKRREALLRALGYQNDQEKKVIVGFFHPYCNSGGGGERVLWAAIHYLQKTEPDVVSVVYTGDMDATKEEIIAKVKDRFNINLDPKTLSFAYLRSRHLVDDKTWPRFTLLGQSLGSMVLGWEAMNLIIPDIYIDTMGYAFTFALIRMIGVRTSTSGWTGVGSIPVGAYVHYPTISTNMLERVRDREAGITNDEAVANSNWRSRAKFIYYQLFAYTYASCLSQANYIVCNSSWTKDHIATLLRDYALRVFSLQRPLKAHPEVLWPSCDCEDLDKFPLEGRERVILSLAQFRPEKNHECQLRALQILVHRHPEYMYGPARIRLIMLGSARNEEDMERVRMLQELAVKLRVKDCVEFVVNAPYEELTKWLAISSVGINTMVDEHFGINVVEFMASGLIPVVHFSGGPRQDIVVPDENGLDTGFYARNDTDFAGALKEIFEMKEEEEMSYRVRARESARRFERSEFEKGWAVFWKGMKEVKRR